MAEWETIDEPGIGPLAEQPSPITLAQAGATIAAAPATHAAAFARDRAFAFADFLSADFAAKIGAICDRVQFVPDTSTPHENRLREEPRLAGAALGIALQQAAVLRWVEQATGCGPLASAYGNVLRVPADGRSNLWWHDDLGSDPTRRIGLTIYLGGPPYEGGLFELREKTGRLLMRHRHTNVASALLFDVAPDLEHRLSPVTGGGPRQVFTGWFTSAAPRP